MSGNQQKPILHCDAALSSGLERAEGKSNAEFVGARDRVFPDAGFEWTEIAGVYALFDGKESPCTQTFGLGLFDPVTATEMKLLEQFFHERDADVFHEFSPLAEMSLLNLLTERGYRPIEHTSILFRPIHADPSLRDVNPSIQVRAGYAG